MKSELTVKEKRENMLLYCTLFAFAVNGATSQPLGSFIPFLRESYNLSYELSGWMLSLQSIGNLTAVLIAGFLPIYAGRRRSALILAVWMSFCYIILSSGLSSPVFLMAAFLMNGISRGGNSNFANTMISTLPQEKATRGYNLVHSCFAFGALCTPILLVACTKLFPEQGWRIMSGLLLIICLIQLLVYARMPLPEEHLEKSVKNSDKSFLREKKFWLSAAMLFFYISTEYAIVGWMVTYFQDIGILSPQHAQLTNSLFWLVICIGRGAGALLSSKIPGTRLLLADGIFQFIFYILMFFSREPGIIIFALMGFGLAMSTIFPTAFAFGSSCVKGSDLGCSFMIFAGSAGGIITPALVGGVAERAGIRAGMALIVLLSSLLLISILLSVLGDRRSRRG